jgi:NAD(P)-dependent dehydrogenase (short-subunit alcohol dehydrogenase family)
MKKEISRFDSLPRVVLLPGLGALCAGRDSSEAAIASDITARTLAAKSRIAAMGSYRGLPEESLFDMEYNSFQRAKLASPEKELPLSGQVGLVTGAAGAIGSGICRGLLEEGCHVAATDLPGSALDSLVDELKARFADRVIGVPLDVTDPASVSRGMEAVVRTWGGVDLAVVNAGAAAVASLAEMDVEKFRELERVNVEGTLLVLRELARHFELQGTGGDIILVSTKNVFAPGAKFGAYSATKAAAHQLGRIASLELAPIGVRVNMVAPDAVFADGARKSGLWREVGPDRMRARGLDEKDLEEHYRNRNLLKARITADHVANAVLFFATRQTPTTGATLPVDGGLPDATPR